YILFFYLYLLFIIFCFFTSTSPSMIFTLSLHDALPIFKTSKYSAYFKLSIFFSLHGRSFPFFEISFKISCCLFLFIKINNKKFRSEEHTSELQSRFDIVCRLLLEKKNH